MVHGCNATSWAALHHRNCTFLLAFCNLGVVHSTWQAPYLRLMIAGLALPQQQDRACTVVCAGSACVCVVSCPLHALMRTVWWVDVEVCAHLYVPWACVMSVHVRAVVHMRCSEQTWLE